MENHQVALEAASLACPQLNSFYFSFPREIKAIVSTLGPDLSDLKQIAYATWWLCLGTQEGSRGFPQILRTPFGFFWREKKDCGVSERKEGLERAETGRPGLSLFQATGSQHPCARGGEPGSRLEAGCGERLRCYSIALAGPTPPESHPNPWETERSFPCFPDTKTEAYRGDPPKGTKSSNKGWNREPSPP